MNFYFTRHISYEEIYVWNLLIGTEILEVMDTLHSSYQNNFFSQMTGYFRVVRVAVMPLRLQACYLCRGCSPTAIMEPSLHGTGGWSADPSEPTSAWVVTWHAPIAALPGYDVISFQPTHGIAQFALSLLSWPMATSYGPELHFTGNFNLSSHKRKESDMEQASWRGTNYARLSIVPADRVIVAQSFSILSSNNSDFR